MNTDSIINCTPHEIVLNSGATFAPSGEVARVSTDSTVISTDDGVTYARKSVGGVVGLPAEQAGVKYIVAAMVFDNCNRRDIVAPMTDVAVRNDKGHIVSVPGFYIK